jgi:hypothetical protein
LLRAATRKAIHRPFSADTSFSNCSNRFSSNAPILGADSFFKFRVESLNRRQRHAAFVAVVADEDIALIKPFKEGPNTLCCAEF